MVHSGLPLLAGLLEGSAGRVGAIKISGVVAAKGSSSVTPAVPASPDVGFAFASALSARNEARVSFGTRRTGELPGRQVHARHAPAAPREF